MVGIQPPAPPATVSLHSRDSLSNLFIGSPISPIMGKHRKKRRAEPTLADDDSEPTQLEEEEESRYRARTLEELNWGIVSAFNKEHAAELKAARLADQGHEDAAPSQKKQKQTETETGAEFPEEPKVKPAKKARTTSTQRTKAAHQKPKYPTVDLSWLASLEHDTLPRKRMLPNLLEIEDVLVGLGARATPGRSVHVRYQGRLSDGTKFDASGRKPFQFNVGSKAVIQGLNLGVVGMRVGGRRMVRIPPHLGYGDKGSHWQAGKQGDTVSFGSGESETSGGKHHYQKAKTQKQKEIPPHATLLFDLELSAVT